MKKTKTSLLSMIVVLLLAALMQADIEQYGLFTYEEFAELLPVSEEVFEAFNGQYLKVAMGKGLISWDTLNRLVARYSVFFSVE